VSRDGDCSSSFDDSNQDMKSVISLHPMNLSMQQKSRTDNWFRINTVKNTSQCKNALLIIVSNPKNLIKKKVREENSNSGSVSTEYF